MTEQITTTQAKQIFARNYFGAASFWVHAGFDGTVPSTLPLSEKAARSFMQLGFDLFYIPKQLQGEAPISSAVLIKEWEGLHPDVSMLYDYHDPHKWYTNDVQSFFYKEYLEPGWVCIKRAPLTDAYFSTYRRQTEILAKYLSDNDLHVGGMMRLSSPLTDDPTLTEELVNKKYRTSFVLELMRMMVVYHEQNERILERAYTWTNSVFQNKEVVRIGAFDESGADVTKRDVFDGNSKTGLTPVVYLGAV